MKLENQSYNKLFQTGNKELVYIVNKAIEEDDIKTINKVISTIKEFRKQTELTKQFGNEILSDIANTIKGTDFFDDNLSLLDNYRLLDNQRDILLKNLVSKRYEFTENQVKEMPDKILFYTLDKYRFSSYYSNILLDEINERIKENRLDIINDNLEFIYVYLFMVNKLEKTVVLNELIKNVNFIKQLDNADIPGSMLITLTDECDRPRNVLLSNSKKIKYSLTKEDELLTPKDILESLTIEEVQILLKDHEIYNAIISSGVRFDALPEKTIENIISDTNNFTIFNMDTVVTVTNNYKDINKLANDSKYVMMYLKKLDHDIYVNKIFKYINTDTIDNLLEEDDFYKLPHYTIINLIEELNDDSFKKITNNDIVFDIISENMNEIIFERLNKTKQLKYIDNKKELNSYDIYLISKLPKKEIIRIFNENASATNALKEYLKNTGVHGIPTVLENIPVHVLEEITRSSLNDITPTSFKSLKDNNIEAMKITIMNNIESLNDINNKHINDIIDLFDFTENQMMKLLNNSERLTQEVVTTLTNRLPKETKDTIYNVEVVRNKIIEDNKKVDEYTFTYLLTNINEISKLDPSNIIEIINSVNDKNKVKILDNEDIITKLYETSFNKDKNFILEINKVGKYIPYLIKNQYTKYYNRELLQNILDNLKIDEKKQFLSNDNLIKNVLDNNQDIYKTYTSLIAKNTYVLTTLNFNILNDEISKMKTKYVEDIVKYPHIEQLIIDINKEHKLTSNFITYLVNSLTGLDYEKYMKMILTYIKESVYATNRKNTTNIFNILPENITKKETDILVEYLLYINHIKEIEPPTLLSELINYTHNSEEELYKKIHKGEEKNIRDNFFKRHYKITEKEAEEIINKYSIDRVDKNIYKEETNFILELITIMKKELHILKEKDGKYKKISMYESHIMRNKIEKMYQTIYNYEIKSKAKPGRKLELQAFGKVINAYETADDFMYLVLNEQLLNNESNYLNNYIDTISKKVGISTTLVSNDNLAIKNRNDIILGYNHIDSIIEMSKYNSPRELIDNSRDISNEIIISNYDNKNNTKYITPDYVMIYESNINEELIEKAYRASMELGNKNPLPIIVIKEDKIIENELKKIKDLETKFSKTNDVNTLQSLLTKYCNNYSGLRISNPDLANTFDPNIIIKIMEKEANRNNSKKALNILKNIVLDENKKYINIPYKYQSIIKFIENKTK